MLEVAHLTVRYGTIAAVDNCSFTVSDGQWLMIVGPNGAGKSTILNAIAQGVPYTGTIRFSGKDLKKTDAATRARSIGVLSQNHFVGYAFTVEEVVRLGRYARSSGLFSRRKTDDDAAVEDALERTGLLSLRRQSVLALSGGELQRVFLAQVFAQNPRYLLLDEPTNHLDPVYQKQIFALIEDWLKLPGRAAVSVVHDLSLAKAYGTQTLLLHRGRAVAYGDTQQVMRSENLNAVYGMDVTAWMKAMLAQWSDPG
ncbi:MAG: ABC transporter ATP-binding protein [Oscillospiraceae bacterium]|nr:ABC transporter ATP-binding protein [Oscillospiraceae bacterium]